MSNNQKRPSLRHCIDANCKDCIYAPNCDGTWRKQVENSAVKNECGFDIAVLTHKRNGGALKNRASPISEMTEKERLFLLSNSLEPNPPLKEEGNAVGVALNKPKRTVNRKKITFDDIFAHNGTEYPVNAKTSGLFVQIMKRIMEQFEIAMTKWKRVFVLRFDLHTHCITNNNKIMTAFRKRLFQKLKREYGFKKIGFCWVREHEKGKKQHYHWVLFLDGDLIRHSARIIKMIKDVWESPTGNYYMPTIKNPFYFVDSEQVAKDAIYRVSYLAKTRGKGYRAKQTKDYQCSRMKL